MLAELRLKLDKVNLQLFEKLKLRKSIVSEIQSLKKSSWNPVREQEVFQDYIKCFPKVSWQEDLSFSLLVEAHAEGHSYPRWSEGIHLNQQKADAGWQLINPILLRIRDESKYSSLNIKDEHRVVIEELWQRLK